jgi:hypothetical protein
MVRLSTDKAHLLKDLADYPETVELWDENGKLVGVFVPANLGRAKRVYAEAIARTDHAELARRAAEPGPRRAPSEILRELEAKYGNASSNGTPVSDPASPESKECTSP